MSAALAISELEHYANVAALESFRCDELTVLDFVQAQWKAQSGRYSSINSAICSTIDHEDYR